MLQVYRFADGALKEIEALEPGSWVRLVDPDETELGTVADTCGTDRRQVEAALDQNEVSRFEMAKGNFCVVVNLPVREPDGSSRLYATVPVSVAMTDGYVVTSCLRQIPSFEEILAQDRFDIDPADQIDFIYRILLSSAELYQKYLNDIDAARTSMVESLGRTTSNADLMKLHQLESALVYFETGLTGNKVAFDLIADDERVRHARPDRSLIDEVLLETQQGIEMASIYRELVSSTRDLFSNTINNTLNTVMKILTSLTIILAVPTIVAGFYGMNVPTAGMPFGEMTYAFGIIFLITLVICLIIAWWLHKRDLL